MVERAGGEISREILSVEYWDGHHYNDDCPVPFSEGLGYGLLKASRLDRIKAKFGAGSLSLSMMTMPIEGANITLFGESKEIKRSGEQFARFLLSGNQQPKSVYDDRSTFYGDALPPDTIIRRRGKEVVFQTNENGYGHPDSLDCTTSYEHTEYGVICEGKKGKRSISWWSEWPIEDGFGRIFTAVDSTGPIIEIGSVEHTKNMRDRLDEGLLFVDELSRTTAVEVMTIGGGKRKKEKESVSLGFNLKHIPQT